MKHIFIVLAAIVALVAAWLLVSRVLPSYTEYRGEKIKLSRYYLDYDDYKNDPDNIDASETPRVQRLVSEAPIAHSFDSKEELINAIFAIKFPGYGAAGLGDGGKGENSITGLSIEIPKADKSRYLIFQSKGGKYLLIDDFIESDIPLLISVHQDGDQLIYSSLDGTRKLARVVSTH